MTDATRARKRKDTSNRRYGPLIRMAAEIATSTDGLPCSVKTVYAVASGWVTSARVSKALKQARQHPEFRAWQRRHRRMLEKNLDNARRRILAAKGRAA
jgi:tellurite resistance protein